LFTSHPTPIFVGSFAGSEARKSHQCENKHSLTMGVLFRKKSGPQPQQQQQQQQQQQRLVFFLPISEGSERQHLHPTKI